MAETAPVSPLATPMAWDLVTEGYVTEIVPTFTFYAKDALRIADVKRGERVLDVACGPGTLSFEAVALGASVSGIDFASNMIDALHARAKREGVTSIDARVGDGMALPYEDGTFDVAFSMFGLIFFPDRDKGLREIHRALKPGGRALISSWQPMDKVELFVEVFTALAAALPNLPFGSGKAPLGEASEAKAAFEQNGFTDVAVHEIKHSTHHASMEAFWDSTERSLAPLVLLRAKLGEEAYAPVGKAVYERLCTRFGDGPQTLEMSAWLTVGRR
jgi:ubiquinone/menaquinone biosynthesis C-methylase UbiE